MSDWITRINRAMDLVLERPHAPLDLEEVARAVHASPFHFHRVFRQVTGETLHAFQKRVRLERALHSMAHTGASLTDIAIQTGFSSSSSFTRAFREQYGVPPSRFDLAGWQEARRAELTAGSPHLQRLPDGENPDGFRVVLRDLPERRFAYVRVVRPFEPGRVTGAAESLVAWARERGLEGGRWYGWMWEDPDPVPLSRCRYDVAVEVPEDVRPDGPVGVQTLPPMRVAVLPVKGDMALETRALDWLYGGWLPRTRCEPAPLPCAEAWHGLPFAHGHEHFELDLHLPVLEAS
ncbi:MAG: AraC family transcriptional regulator [Myxococcales bacterium]|nr:AraC family transcriptional regulator [Myxococcales bacterium]